MIQQLLSAVPETTHSSECAGADKRDVIYQGHILPSHMAVTSEKF